MRRSTMPFVIIGLGAGMALSSWLLLHGFVAPLSDGPKHLLGFIALAASTSFLLSASFRPHALRGGMALLLAAASFWAPHGVATALLVAAWAVLRFVPGLGALLVTLELIASAAERSPEIGVPLEALATVLGRLVPGDAVAAGPTPLALVPLLVCSAAVLLAAWKGEARHIVIVGLAALAAIEVFHLRMFHTSSGTEAAGLQAFARLPWTVGGMSLVAASCLAWSWKRSRAVEAPTERPWRHVMAPLAAGLGLAMMLPFVAAKRPTTVVRVLNEGGLDWDRPAAGNYEAFGGGMFGLLPVYLAGDGFRFELLAAGPVDDAALDQTDVLLVINCPKVWSEDEAGAVDRFLRRGSSVLVLADHTDVFGLQKGTNSLIERYGMSLRFDSAYHARPSWEGCLDVRAGAPWSWARPRFDDGHAIGASIATSGPWLLRSPFSFSDEGIRENTMGSFLGDYQYTAGERLGDLVLAAWRPVGAGRLVVYGDTSAFQNGSIVQTEGRHILPLLSWLGTPAGWLERDLGRYALASSLLLAGLALLASRSGRIRADVVGIAFAAGMAAGGVASRALAPCQRPGGADVLVDFSKQPWQGHYMAGMNVITPLVTNLQRMGLQPRHSFGMDEAELLQSKAVAFVAPLERFEESEVDLLVRYQESGGIVILAAGYEHRSASLPLLRSSGLELAPRPLGSLPLMQYFDVDPNVPRFVDAWPIVAEPGTEIEVLANWGEDAIAVFRPRGRGGLLLFSDSRFFSERNVEGMWGHWPGSVRFLHNVFTRFLGGKPENVAPVFPSPIKPS